MEVRVEEGTRDPALERKTEKEGGSCEGRGKEIRGRKEGLKKQEAVAELISRGSGGTGRGGGGRASPAGRSGGSAAHPLLWRQTRRPFGWKGRG